MFDSVGDLPGVGPGNLSYRVGLSDSEEILDLPNIVGRITLDGVPEGMISQVQRMANEMSVLDHQEVSMVRFMSEERCANQVVVQRRDRLSRVDVAKLHEG